MALQWLALERDAPSRRSTRTCNDHSCPGGRTARGAATRGTSDTSTVPSGRYASKALEVPQKVRKQPEFQSCVNEAARTAWSSDGRHPTAQVHLKLQSKGTTVSAWRCTLQCRTCEARCNDRGTVKLGVEVLLRRPGPVVLLRGNSHSCKRNASEDACTACAQGMYAHLTHIRGTVGRCTCAEAGDRLAEHQ